MSWQIRVPFRDRGDLVLEVIAAARDSHLPEQEVQVVDVLARDALERGITTVGGLLDELGQLDRSGGRRRLDWARERAGLVSATETDRRREDAAFDRAFERLQPPGPDPWSPLQRCAICGVYPTKDGGAWAKVTVEKWHCSEHEHLAAEGDMAEHARPIVGLSPNGAPIYSEAERRRRAEWVKRRDEKEQRVRRQREEHERREAEVIEEAKQRFVDEGEISIMGIRTRPDGRIIAP